jgi:hypothetical protein
VLTPTPIPPTGAAFALAQSTKRSISGGVMKSKYETQCADVPYFLQNFPTEESYLKYCEFERKLLTKGEREDKICRVIGAAIACVTWPVLLIP